MRRRALLAGTLAIPWIPLTGVSSRLRNALLPPASEAEPALLLHGLWMRGYAMTLLAYRLRAAGFAPEIVEYFTLIQSPDVAAEWVRRRMQHYGERPVHLVGHSLGGLVALLATREHQRDGRTVCIGSPLLGSESARHVSAMMPLAVGKSAGHLANGLASWGGSREVGVIAGNLSRGLGRMFRSLDGDNDGTVTVAETRLPGIADHLVLPHSHTGLPFAADCATQVVEFLRNGRFVQPSKGQ